MRWIGLDPSLSNFGWAVMSRELGGQPTVVEMGTWRTKPEAKDGKLADRARRVLALAALLDGKLREHGVQDAYVESLAFVHGQTSYVSTSASGRVRGLIEGICFCRGISLAEVTSQTVKQAVTGRPGASKFQVAQVLRRTYRLSDHEAEQLDATDALAVAHVGAHRGGNGFAVTSGVVSYRPSSIEDELGLDF